MTEQTVDLKKMTISECKALAYDLMAQAQQLNQNLQFINNEIVTRSQKPTEANTNLEKLVNPNGKTDKNRMVPK